MVPNPDSPAQPFLDRTVELGTLRVALEGALEGSGGLVLVGGEPGIGKTCLARVFAEETGARGVPVWWGRGWEDGSAPPFWPWNAALRGWIDRAGPDVVQAAGGCWLPDLAHVFPVLRERIPGVVPRALPETERARFHLLDVTTAFLAAIAAPAGLVVVLDDVHWADGPSRRLLEFAATGLRGSRVLVVATYRDTEVRQDEPFFATLSRLAREASTQRLLMTGLSASYCARWAELAGVRGDPRALGESLHRETNGNPFFLAEVVRLLASEGRSGASGDPRRVPQGVREVVARRLERLGPACRATLAVAALLGDTIDTTILREVLGEARVDDRLALAEHDRILVAVEGCSGQRRFAHALIRRVLAGELKPSERAAWHARIAAVLERDAPVSDVVTGELVRHLAAVGSPATLRRACDHAWRAAERAARGLAWEEAARFYGLALDAGGRCGALDTERGLELRIALARALRGTGDVPAARAQCEEVMAACRRTPQPVLLARAALVHAGPMPEVGRVDAMGRAILEEACRGADALDDGLRARLSARLARDLLATNEAGQGDRIRALCDEAARAARRAGDAGALAMALVGTVQASALGIGPLAGEGAGAPRAREILDVMVPSGDDDCIAAVRHARATTRLALGDAEGFAAEVDGIVVTAHTSRVPEVLWLADALGALHATVTGRFADAQQLIERALATGRRLHVPNAAATHASQRIMWHAAQGRLAEIVPELDAFVEGHPGGVGWRPLRALARLARGDSVAARAEYRTLVAAGLTGAACGVTPRGHLAGLAALCVALRDREHAPALHDAVARQEEPWIVEGCHTLGPWALVLGALARLCEQPADAARHLEAAIALGQRMRALPIVARAQSMLASVRASAGVDAGEPGDLADLLAEAGQGARRFGLVDVRARVERLQAGRASRRAGSPRTFRREGEVWTAVYRGRELRLRDGKGPRYLATLLAAPGRAFHVLELAAGAVAREVAVVPSDGLAVGEPGGAIEDGPDAQARRAYRSRLDDLRAELEEAERFRDRGRMEHLRAELEMLETQLSARFGRRVRTRGPAETARKAVTKVLRTQIGKLLDLHPSLGRHLLDTVRMGTKCVYAPGMPNDWNVLFR